MTTLKKILVFNNIAPGGSATLPHTINVNGVDLTPDKLYLSNADFSATCTATDVTVTNNSAAIESCTVLCESWHDIERQFGTRFNDPFTNPYKSSIVWQSPTPTVPQEALTPQPFIVSGGGGSGGLPIFTQGSVPFGDGAGSLTQDNTTFFWDNTNKYLGLGINVPASKLHASTDSISTNRTAGLIVNNNTAAAAGAQQYAPAIFLSGYGWKTDAVAESQLVTWSVQGIPVQGTANPTGTLDFAFKAGGAVGSGTGFSTVWRLTYTSLSNYTYGIGGTGTYVGRDAVLTYDSIGTAQTVGFTLQNTTAAAAGAQQYSPVLKLSGYGWKTTAVAASQRVDFLLQVRPVEGTTAPTGQLDVRSSINSGALGSYYWTFNSAGELRTYASGAATCFAIQTGGDTPVFMNAYTISLQNAAQATLHTSYVKNQSPSSGAIYIGYGRNATSLAAETDTYSPTTAGNRGHVIVTNAYTPNAAGLAANFVGTQFNPQFSSGNTGTGAFTGVAIAVKTGGTATFDNNKVFDFGTTSTDYFTGYTSILKLDTVGRLTHATPAVTAFTAATEFNSIYFNLGTVQWATGSFGEQRSIYITVPTYTFVGDSTINAAATVCIAGNPLAGAHATLTYSHALWIYSGSACFGQPYLVSSHITIISKNSAGSCVQLWGDRNDSNEASYLEWAIEDGIIDQPTNLPRAYKGCGYVFMKWNGVVSPGARTQLCAMWEDGSVTVIAEGPAS